MTSRPWNTLLSILVFALALATAGSARAQFGFGGTSSHSSDSAFGWGYGTATVQGISPFDSGSFGAESYAGLGRIRGFPVPGYGRSIGRTPQTITSFQSVSDVVTLVPGWNRSAHRVHHRH
jgi:hypothetical protein